MFLQRLAQWFAYAEMCEGVGGLACASFGVAVVYGLVGGIGRTLQAAIPSGRWLERPCFYCPHTARYNLYLNPVHTMIFSILMQLLKFICLNGL